MRVLGGLAVEGVDLARLGSRKARRLLARLALARGAPVSVDALIDTVWGDDPPSQPAEQLSVLISRLRSAMHTALPRTAAGYALEAGWLDVAALAELVAEAQARLRSGAAAPARAAAQAALDLVRGPLLPDEDDAPWLAAERTAVARDTAAARLIAAEAALAVGDPWAAARLADEALAVERFDEAALRVLMTAQARAGRPALALQAYTEMRERLEEELGVDPAPETAAVHLSVLRGQTVDAPVRPLPGRSAELARLRAAFDAGTGQLVVVDGPPGIGKTRLLDEFARRLDGVTVLRAAGEELGGGLPLQPILDGLADHVELDYPRGTPHLTASGSSGANLLTAALDRATAELCARSRVVWLLDDAQWADQPTIAWLHHIVRRTPVLVVLARRPEEGIPPRPHETVHVGPLDRSAVAEVLGEPATSPRAGDLFQRSGGHPMFLLELARSTGELPESIRDAVAERCDRAGPSTATTLRAAAVLGADVDLDLLAAVLAARPAELLDHLEEGVRRHLLIETGTGFAFAHQLVRAALRASTSTGRAALLHREAASWLAQRRTADPGDVAFHALRGGDRRLAARALADAAEIASSRFEHDEAGRLLDEALALVDEPVYRIARARTRVQAGRLADADADATEALAVAVEPIDRAAALEAAALVAYHRRDIDRCRTLAEQGAAEATRAGSGGFDGSAAFGGAGDPAGAAGSIGAAGSRGVAASGGVAAHGRAAAASGGAAAASGGAAAASGGVAASGRADGPGGVAEHGRAAAASGGVAASGHAAAADELAASCLAIAGRAALVLGDLTTSSELLTQAQARTTGPVRPIADLNLAWLYAQADRPTDALRVLSATEPVRASRVPFVQPQRHLAAAHAYAHLGRIADAFVELDRLDEASAREHTERYAGRADNYRGWILRNLGDYARADDLNAGALEAAGRIRMGEPFAHAALDLCDAALRRGDPATALDRLATAADTGGMPHAYRWRHELRARLLAGRCALATGDFPAALEALDGVRLEAAQMGLRRYHVIAAVLLAETRYRAGERVPPVSVAADVEALAEVASLESWWLTAALAKASGVDEWHRLAAQRVARLAESAGDHARSLARAWAAFT